MASGGGLGCSLTAPWVGTLAGPPTPLPESPLPQLSSVGAWEPPCRCAQTKAASCIGPSAALQPRVPLRASASVPMTQRPCNDAASALWGAPNERVSFHTRSAGFCRGIPRTARGRCKQLLPVLPTAWHESTIHRAQQHQQAPSEGAHWGSLGSPGTQVLLAPGSCNFASIPKSPVSKRLSFHKSAPLPPPQAE